MENQNGQFTVVVRVSEDTPIDLPEIIDEFERQVITGALGITAGIKAKAARVLGLKRTTLVEKMRRYGMPLSPRT